MAFWSREKKESLTDGRKFKRADLTDFNPPVFVSEREIKSSDEELISKLRDNFTEAGVINFNISEEENDEQSLNELVGLLHEANEGALSEKDFHESKTFDEDLHSQLDDYERIAPSGENFLLDGMDDYGNQLYEAGDGSKPIWE